jgi:hypothetical protein
VNPSFQNSPLRKFPFSLNSHLQPVLSGRVYPADFFRLLSFAQIPFEIREVPLPRPQFQVMQADRLHRQPQHQEVVVQVRTITAVVVG